MNPGISPTELNMVRRDAPAATRLMESLHWLRRTHWDHEPAGGPLTPSPSPSEGERVPKGRERGRFTERLHQHVPVPRDRVPERVQGRAGGSPDPRARQRGPFRSVGFSAGGRRDACPGLGMLNGRGVRRASRLAGLLPVALYSLVATAWVVSGQEARLVNAQTQMHTIASSLAQEFQALFRNQVEAAWIGYAVAIVEGNHHICCSGAEDRHKPVSLRHARCQLEGRDDGMNFNTNGDDDDRAERTIGNIRVFTDDCELDAGGLSVHWLTEVKPTESIKLLTSFVEGQENSKTSRRIRESAIAAIALHADPAADGALKKFVGADRPEEVRKTTAFWLGNLRGQAGYEILRRLVREDPSEKVREHCTFALHVSKVPQAVNAMIEAAREDKSAHVRGQALFWLSQKAGEKAAKAISDAIENDPETEVKKKAVFALSQLPKDEGVPKLINAARKNRNKEVRKDAMFWLGQSNDSRALAFFEEVLTH